LVWTLAPVPWTLYYKENTVKKSIVLIVAGLLIAVPFGAHAFPTKKGDKPCAECHTLDKKAAEAIVKRIVPTATVTNVKLSPVKGVWQVEFEAAEGKRGAFGLDFSKKYLVQFASVEDVVKQQQPQPPRKVDVSKIPLNDAITLGAANANKKVIVFTDPDCPYCRQLHTIMKQVVAKRSDISFAVIMNPLPMHKDASKKAQTILCTKSLDILDDAFAGKTVPEPAATCTTEAVERSKALASSLEFNGTPTLVRDDGLVLSGFLPEEKLIGWIDKKQ
jgi:thiol:disulfide interchange protein DsbC